MTYANQLTRRVLPAPDQPSSGGDDLPNGVVHICSVLQAEAEVRDPTAVARPTLSAVGLRVQRYGVPSTGCSEEDQVVTLAEQLLHPEHARVKPRERDMSPTARWMWVSPSVSIIPAAVSQTPRHNAGA